MSEDDKAVEEAIEKAFMNPKYTWRTVRGVSKETGLGSEQVISYVLNNGDEIIKSSSNNNRGEALFANRKVYRSKASPVRRVMSALKNRGG